MTAGLTTRAFEPTDESFIYSTWLRGLYYGNEWFRKIDKQSFFDKYRLVIQHLLATSTIKVICLEDAPDVIAGYVVYSGTKLHWVYVKKSWRGIGLGRELVPTDIESVTHLTEKAAKKKNPLWRFDPLLEQ